VTTEKAPSVPRVICGSYAGYKAHRKHNEIVCKFCREARNVWEKGRREARATATNRAQLTDEERQMVALPDWKARPSERIEYVEGLIADRLLRYT